MISAKRVKKEFATWSVGFETKSDRNKGHVPDDLLKLLGDARECGVTPKELEAATGISVYKIHKLVLAAKNRKLTEGSKKKEIQKEKEKIHRKLLKEQGIKPSCKNVKLSVKRADKLERKRAAAAKLSAVENTSTEITNEAANEITNKVTNETADEINEITNEKSLNESAAGELMNASMNYLI